LVVHLIPVAGESTAGKAPPAQPDWAEPPHGRVLASVGMPRPRLMEIAPGETQTEGAVIELDPGLVTRQGHDEPLWGRYQLSVSYDASYSNADALSRDLGVSIWQGEALSNDVETDLEPARASAAGSISGRMSNEDGRLLGGILVSLSDGADHLVAQSTTGDEGSYSFRGLPWGLYWVTGRRPWASIDAAVFDHFNLSAGDPTGTINLVILDPEIYQAKQKLHKPVLLRVTSGQGQPLAGVELDALWSSGDIAENVKGLTANDGTAALDLIPGRNYVTLKRRKCKNQESRVDVAEGDGIDGLSLQFDCAP
jgi:Carboxypeptidase regulatory-like domain